MTIRFLLTAGLLLCALYAHMQARYSRYLSSIVYLCAGVGIYFVWFPGHASAIANGIGVGRGADLVLYIWVLLSFVVSIHIHIRIRAAERQVTLLAREMALSRPYGPAPAQTDEADTHAEEGSEPAPSPRPTDLH